MPTVIGAIRDKWIELGGASSFLGEPLTDEMDFPEGGKVSVFQGGAIYWWPDTGAIELNNVVIHYTGLICFGETNDGPTSSADEPYVVIGLTTPTGTSSIRSQIYNSVDAGFSRPDVVEVYHGKPTGLALSILLMEHDSGNPDKYKDEMGVAIQAAIPAVQALLTLIPKIGKVISTVAGPILQAIAPTVTNALNSLLGTEDDRIGDSTIALSAKQMVVLATRTGVSVDRGVGFKVETPLLSGDGGSYKVYFNLIAA